VWVGVSTVRRSLLPRQLVHVHSDLERFLAYADECSVSSRKEERERRTRADLFFWVLVYSMVVSFGIRSSEWDWVTYAS